MRVLVLADTHLRPGRARSLPDKVLAELPLADAVLHAGDIVTEGLLDQLRDAVRPGVPVHAVLGNNDTELRGQLPERLELDLAGVRVAMVHETGASKGRPARVRRWFPDAHVVVFGHSHAPMCEWNDGQLLFNPGSAVDRRRQPVTTYGVLELTDGAVTEARIVNTD